MRWSILVVFVLLAGCPQGSADLQAAGDDKSTDPGAPDMSCFDASDCELAGKSCCECKTFALPMSDPKLSACDNVPCPPPTMACPKIHATCDRGKCAVACEPQAITMTCADGFASDMAGCLIDACALPMSACAVDADCVRTRADCCGCARGGQDTAVPVAVRGEYEAGLGCTGSASCPEVSTCVAEETAQCAQGECRLIAGEVPPDACGRPDLPACPVGKTCTVNVNATADRHGVGVCL
jgi:hypothetical protein